MPSTLLLRTLSAFLLLLFVVAGCGSDDTPDADDVADEPAYRLGPPLTDSTLALVIESEAFGDATLTAAEFRRQYNRFLQQIPPQVALDPVQTAEVRRGLAEEFILRHILGSEARRLGITSDPADVEAQIAQIRQNFESEEELEQALAEQDMTLDSLRVRIAEDLVLQQMQERMLEGAVDPTAAEVEAFREEQGEQVRAQHILFRIPDPAREDSVRDVAEAVLDSIRSGADFAEMARRYGSDGTAQRGGDLGFFSRNDMVGPFSEAAFALSDSGAVVREPVETQFGYHLIRLTGRRTVPVDSARARAMMMQTRQRDALDVALDSLRAQALIRVNPDVLGVDLNEGRDG